MKASVSVSALPYLRIQEDDIRSASDQQSLVLSIALHQFSHGNPGNQSDLRHCSRNNTGSKRSADRRRATQTISPRGDGSESDLRGFRQTYGLNHLRLRNRNPGPAVYVHFCSSGHSGLHGSTRGDHQNTSGWNGGGYLTFDKEFVDTTGVDAKSQRALRG